MLTLAIFVAGIGSVWGQVPGNACASAVALTAPAIGATITTGAQTTCGRLNDFAAGFSSVNASYGGGEDAVYSMVVPAGGGNYTFTFAASGATYKILSIHSACAPTTANTLGGFVTGAATGGSVTLNLTAGTRFIIIDTWPTPNCGAFTLSITRNNPPCGSAINIPSAPVTNQALSCNTTAVPGALNATNVPTACGGASNNYKGGQDAIYTFTPSTTGSYTISYTGVTYSAIFVYSGACPASGGTCVGSVGSAGSTQSLTVSLTAGVQYFIWFDTWPAPNSPCPGTFSISAPPIPPTISSISPASGCPGATVTINGTNLTGATAANVRVGGTPVTAILTNTGTQITATVGAGTTGVVSVITPDGTANSVSTFTVNTSPAAPTANAASAITTTTATASWSASAGATQYFLDVSTVNTFVSFVGSYNNLNVGNVTSVSLTGLSPNTTYFYRVRASNGSCSGVSSGTITFFTGYCTPTSNCAFGTFPNVDVIASVTLNTLSNVTNGTCGAGGYSNYTTNPSLTTTLLPSQTYNVTVGVAGYAQSVAVWIDYNDDLVFDNVTERVGATAAASPIPVNSTASFPIVLGCNPPAGPHRMRVRSSDNSIVNGPAQTPCANYSYGETEDYLITIAAAPACPSPGLMTTVTPATTSASLTWATNCSSSTTYDFEYGPAGFTQGTGTLLTNQTVSIASPNASYTLSGLTQNTSYSVYYRARCGGVTSAWSIASNFTTLCAAQGNENTYGNGSWIGYVYNSAAAGQFTTYRGYVTESETFNTTHATTPNGATIVTCPANSDLFAIRYRMTKTFAPGNYVFTIGGDDGVRLSIDGGATWLINGWVDQGYTTYSSGSVALSGAYNLVFEFYENSGGAQSSFSYIAAPSITSVTPDPVCPSETITISGNNFTSITGVTINGVAATSYSVVNSSTITAVVPVTTSGVVAVTNSVGSATSNSITVNSNPAAPTSASSAASSINVGGSTTLSSSAGANTVWYTQATGGTSVGSGDNWAIPVQCTPGTLTYFAESNNGTCPSASRTAVSITVRPIIASNPSNALICSAGGSVTLSAQLTGAGSSITWSPNTNLSTTSGASTVASPTSTTVYTVNATVAGCGSVSATQSVGVIDAVAFTPTSTPAAVCAGNTALLASNLASSGFTVQSITNSPSTPVSPTNLSNGGASPVVPLTSGNNDDGGWGSIPLGFTYNFFGTNYSTVNVGTNGVIQFGAYNANGGFTAPFGLGDYTFTNAFPTTLEPMNIIAGGACDLTITNGTVRYWTQGIAPTRIFVLDYNVFGLTSGSNNFQIKLFETTGIVEIHVTSNTAQGGVNKVIGINNSNGTIGSTAYSSANNLTNTAWKFVPGANYTFQWATAGSNISGATSTTYTTPVLSTPGTVSYSVAATNPNTQCTTTQSVNITVNSLPAAPVSLGDVTACNTAGSQNLVVSTGAGETADWYNASTAGTLLTNNNTTHATATAGTYFAEAENTTTGCKSATRTAVTLNTNTAPSAPTASGASYCQGATATALSASAPSGSNTQSWYTVAVGGTPLAGAPTPSTASAGTTDYYVSETSGSNGCESSRTTVSVTVNATPAAPSASNPSAYCQNATASALSATSDGSSTLYWYTVPTGGTGSTTAITPSTSTAGTATYYVSQLSASNCESSRTAITVTVNPTITASVTNSASSTSACGGGAITFTATPTNGGTPTYQWFLNGAAVSGEINPTYSLATPADADAIYVEMTPSAQTCLSSSAATASNTVTLTSTASTPTVSIQSNASSAFCPGTSVTFSVNSSANMGSSPTYQWNLNGTPISGATNPSLVTTTLNNNDQVTLTMTSSLNGTCLTQSDATSTSITSLVNSSTSITSQPVDASACTGSSASFTVAGAGQGTLTYQWKKNGANITGNATATTSTLTISGIAAGDAANYTVDVIGACGTATSNTAALALNAVTAISVQPVAVTACNGLTATYNVTASGQGTLSYQWRKDGSPISGATNSSYSLSSITSTNAGNYSVVVSGGCGNVTSSNAALTVQPATLISSQPSASTICQNNTANFAVTATGQGALSYQWKLNGNAISGATGSTLAVSNAQAINAGSYTVDVTAGCGTTSSNTAALTVNPATSITTQPVGTAGCEGQNTTFTVVAAGTGTLSYQWKYGSTNVGTNSSSYNIASTSTANDGNYSVVVTGGCGNTTSNTVALNVYASPATPAVISTADITDATLCGKNQVTVSASTPGAESTGEWSVVGNWGIVPEANTDPNTTFLANNAALGGSPKQLVWSHIRETSGNFCYSHDTITVEFKQPSITPIAGVIQNGDVVWGGLSSSDWSTSDNWYQYQSGALIRMTQGEPTASTKVYALSNSVGGTCVSSVNSPSLGASESAANMYVGVGATLNLSNGAMTIAGDLINNGTINPGSGTVTFDGSSVQKITGTGTTANLNNVIVNKTGGTLTLEQPTKVAGTLTMTQGDIVTDNVNLLEVGSSVSAVGSVNWTAGTVRGPMKRWFAAATNSNQATGIFPVGATIPGKGVINRYAQVNFTSAPGTGGYIIAEYKTGTPSTGYAGLPLTYGVNQYIQNYEEEGYWDITPYNASGSEYAALNTAPYTLKLRMNNPSTLQPGTPPSGSNGNAIADISKIRIITSKGPSHNTWVLAGTQGAGHSVLASGDYLLEETGVTGFSFFNGGGNDNNPLPVELTSFSGICNEGNITLTWQTASEFNSSHFDVEKSRDGENWQMLATVPSAGTSNELLTYQTVDQNATDGNNYFRLRQVDIDGTEKVYDPINVSCAEVTPGYFSSFPNPSGTSFQLIVNNKELIGTCVLNMVDATGKVIEQREIEVKDGINMFVINQELTPGIYFMNISNGSKSTSVLRHAVK
jgi:hypothetical protein